MPPSQHPLGEPFAQQRLGGAEAPILLSLRLIGVEWRDLSVLSRQCWGDEQLADAAATQLRALPGRAAPPWVSGLGSAGTCRTSARALMTFESVRPRRATVALKCLTDQTPELTGGARRHLGTSPTRSSKSRNCRSPLDEREWWLTSSSPSLSCSS
jgi:hypothetical protein